MNKTTKNDRVDSAIEKYREAYPKPFKFRDGKTSEDTINALKNEADLTEDKVCGIVGNNSWTNLICDECKLDCQELVTLGEAPNYESSTASICKSCLAKALAL